MITCFVPAFNEEKNIESTIQSIVRSSKRAKVHVEICVVNDGSSDQTAQIVTRLMKDLPQLQLLQNETNRGLGYSFRRVLEQTKTEKFLIVPGDNDMAEQLLFELFSNAHRAEIIMAYFLNREIRGVRRNIISNIFASIYMITFRIFVQYINGPAIYPTEKLRNLELKANRFSIVVEATIKLLRQGCSYYEVAGYMQKGVAGSSSLSWRNLVEVMRSYCRLIWEVKVSQRQKYNKYPERIYGNPNESDVDSEKKYVENNEVNL